MRGEEIPKMAFWTRYGHYEFLVMSFGLTKDPVMFINLMNRFFQSNINSFVIVFIDNIMVYLKNVDEHMHHLRVVLQVHKKNKLFAKYRNY